MNRLIANLSAPMLVYLHPCKLFISHRTDEMTNEIRVYIGFFDPQKRGSKDSIYSKDIYRSAPLTSLKEAKKLIRDILIASVEDGEAQMKKRDAMSTMIRGLSLTPLTIWMVEKFMKELDNSGGELLTYNMESSLRRSTLYGNKVAQLN